MARQRRVFGVLLLLAIFLLDRAQGSHHHYKSLKKKESESWHPWALRRHRGARKAANNNNKSNLRQTRRVEDGWNYRGYDVNNDEGTEYFGDMFVTAPKEWTPLEWGLFAAMMTTFAVAFFCFCILVIIPRCCGCFGPTLYALLVT